VRRGGKRKGEGGVCEEGRCARRGGVRGGEVCKEGRCARGREQVQGGGKCKGVGCKGGCKGGARGV
jgi:hypothetical protein